MGCLQARPGEPEGRGMKVFVINQQAGILNSWPKPGYHKCPAPLLEGQAGKAGGLQGSGKAGRSSLDRGKVTL